MFRYVCLDDINQEIRDLRLEVFVIEQGIDPEIEIEKDEYNYKHLCLYKDDTLVAYARAKVKGEVLRLGRILVKKEYRGQGLGKAIMKYCEEIAKQNNCAVLELHAQHQAIEFYEKLGYEPIGDYFLEANIKHKKMKKYLTQLP
ncbi:MAG TPA: GNAT family N-acetyltransferase [Clostridiales bacterium]|jgi:predicted GNAT family N-acyltransferase|nr:GNAT family N-acetyltransferase [Clostridiales bacterium]